MSYTITYRALYRKILGIKWYQWLERNLQKKYFRVLPDSRGSRLFNYVFSLASGIILLLLQGLVFDTQRIVSGEGNPWYELGVFTKGVLTEYALFGYLYIMIDIITCWVINA